MFDQTDDVSKLCVAICTFCALSLWAILNRKLVFQEENTIEKQEKVACIIAAFIYWAITCGPTIYASFTFECTPTVQVFCGVLFVAIAVWAFFMFIKCFTLLCYWKIKEGIQGLSLVCSCFLLWYLITTVGLCPHCTSWWCPFFFT